MIRARTFLKHLLFLAIAPFAVDISVLQFMQKTFVPMAMGILDEPFDLFSSDAQASR